jgi:hypothetical protein
MDSSLDLLAPPTGSLAGTHADSIEKASPNHIDGKACMLFLQALTIDGLIYTTALRLSRDNGYNNIIAFTARNMQSGEICGFALSLKTRETFDVSIAYGLEEAEFKNGFNSE